MFLNKQWIFTKGVVIKILKKEAGSWLYRWHLRGQNELVVDAVVSL